MQSKTVFLPVVTIVIALAAPAAAPFAEQRDTTADVVLRPTNHPVVPADLTELWLAPDTRHTIRTAALDELARAVKLEVESNFTKALPILSRPSVQQGALGHYAQYYKGFAELRLGRPADARATFRALAERGPVGYLTEAVALREAECDEALGDWAAAQAVYEQLSRTKTTMPDDVLMRLGSAAKAAGDQNAAAAAFSRVYFEYPLNDSSLQASAELDNLPTYGTIAPGTLRYKRELARADRLFTSKHYPEARAAFENLKRAADGDDRELVNLRIAESDYFLKHARLARDGLNPYIDSASRQGEALFFYAVATLELGDEADYVRTIRRIVSDFPTQTWSEEALNSLATHFVQRNDETSADEIFRELYAKAPTGRYADRAATKIGWWAFKNGWYPDTIRMFEHAAADFPRSDYRPRWLYWAARAHEALQESSLAEARYRLLVTDYLNTYYGRLAVQHLDGRALQNRLVIDQQAPVSGGPTAASSDDPIAPPPLPPNQQVVRALLGLKLYDQAVDELNYAQRTWGPSPAIDATSAWIYLQQGQAEIGTRQFALFRGAINTMRRAYPQFLAAGGENLPREVLKVIFPIAYWDLIRKYAGQRNLDPYFVAALVAQESTFVPDIKSPANAVGLMQLMPATAKQYARILKIPYSARLLTNPEVNIRMGTAYLADKIKQFGQPHLALASYNAGEGVVRRWMNERPAIALDEFIDDIPYPETQNYVKRILGTAEDYRRLYGPDADGREGDATTPDAVSAEAAAPAAARAAAPASASKANVVSRKKAPVRKATAGRKSDTLKRKKNRVSVPPARETS